MARNDWQQRYLQHFYNRDHGWVDGTTEFHDLCAGVIPSGGRILEIGAGPSNNTSRYIAGIGELYGVDPDEAVLQNDALASAATLTDSSLPYDAAMFDACVSNWVVEHIADPLDHLTQINRVLKPGAPYIFRTPNINHYVHRVASLTPYAFHRVVANRLRNLPPDVHDPYPTVYSMNSAKAIRRVASEAGFSVAELRLVEKEPTYGLASRALFFPFLAYERTVNATYRLSNFRATILAALRSRR